MAAVLLVLGTAGWLAWWLPGGPAPGGQAFAAPLVTATPTLAPGTGAIVGTAWQDANADGVHDSGELPLPALVVTLSNQAGEPLTTAMTGTDGGYRFGNLQPGIYRLSAAPPTGYVLTTPPAPLLVVSAGAVLVQDFGAKFVPTPTPTETPLPALDTGNAVLAMCGSTIWGDTRTGANNVSRYACQPFWDESGPEVVYRIELGSEQLLSASFVSTTADLDLFLLPSGNPADCLVAGDNTLSYEAFPAFYYLAVEGYQGAAGNFTMHLSCPLNPQATATPTLTPSATPSATPTSTPGPTATPTATPQLEHEFLPLVLRQSSEPTPEPVVLTLQQDLNGYTGASDTYLSHWNDNGAYGNADVLYLRLNRQTAVTTHMAPLLRFDLGLLPVDAHIVSATLNLYLVIPPGGYDILAEVHGLLRPWDELTATWLQSSYSQPWIVSGAQGVGTDYMPWISDSKYIELKDRWYSFDVSDLVRLWVSDPAKNNGAIYLARVGLNESNQAGGFASREFGDSSLRPRLVLTYRVDSKFQ